MTSPEVVSMSTLNEFKGAGFGENQDEEEFLIQLFKLKANQSSQSKDRESWLEISKELGIELEQCRNSFSKTFSKYKESKSSQHNFVSTLFQTIDELENHLEFDYCFENFSDLCRFCLQLRSEETNFRNILNDSSEQELLDSNELIKKINFTLYDNILEKVDFKLSNLICTRCQAKIEEFDSFKRQCDRHSELLTQVKNELDKMQEKPEPCATHGESLEELIEASRTIEGLENEDEEIFSNDGSQSEDEECDDEEQEDDMLDMDPDEDDAHMTTITKSETSNNTKRERNRKSYKGKNSQCPICGKLVKGIQMHMLIHSGERRHKCSYCSKSFTQSGQLKRHINSHLNIRNYKCPEPGCGRTFVDPSSVTKHLVVHNKEDRKFQCSLCGSRFNRLGALRYHEKTHRQERNHSCDICKKSFLAKYDLTKHYRTHTGEKPYSCKFCDKRFSISKNAKVHLRVHTKEKPYSCRFCDLSFAYRSSMKNHLIKIHNQADFSSLPILQAINIAMRNNSDQDQLEDDQIEAQISVEALEVDLTAANNS